MCKYCETDEFTDCGDYYNYFEKNGGFSEDFTLYSEDGSYSEHFRIELEMMERGILVIEFYSLDHDDDFFVSKKVKINHCPWCGRKLNEES